MAQFGERIEDTTATTGTGALTIDSVAPNGFATIAQEITDGQYFPYVLEDANGIDWEEGFGLVSGSGLAMTRDNVIRSTNADAAIPLTAGTHNILGALPGFLLNRRGVRAFTDGTPTMASNVWTSVNFATPVVNTDSMWSAGNPERITPPPWARGIKINAVCRWDSPVSGDYGARIGLAGVPGDAIGLPQIILQSQSDPRITIASGEIDASAAAYFTLLMRQTTGVALTPFTTSTWIEAIPIP